jgi:hypothetical protein
VCGRGRNAAGRDDDRRKQKRCCLDSGRQQHAGRTDFPRDNTSRVTTVGTYSDNPRGEQKRVKKGMMIMILDLLVKVMEVRSW